MKYCHELSSDFSRVKDREIKVYALQTFQKCVIEFWQNDGTSNLFLSENLFAIDWYTFDRIRIEHEKAQVQSRLCESYS